MPAPQKWAIRIWRGLTSAVALLRMQVGGALGLAPRLPPGSLGVSAVARLGGDGFYLQKFRQYGPIFKVLWNQNLTVCIVGFQRARRLLAVHAHVLAPVHVDIESFVPKGFLRTMAPDHHPHYRALFLSALRAQSTTPWEPEIRRNIQIELRALADATEGGAARAEASLVPALDRIAMHALLVPFFGLTPEDPMFAALEAGYRRLGPTGFVYPIGSEQREAFSELRVVVWQIVAALKANPHAASSRGQLARLLESGDGSAVDETVVGNLIYMIEVGRFDVRSLLRWVLKYLSDHPAVVADLGVRSIAAEGSENLAEACVLETLRLDQAEAMNRAVREEFVFEGYRFPKGSAVRVLMRETHKDPEVFTEPEQFKPCRFVGKVYSPDAYAPFGVGEHRCIAGPMVVRLCTLFVEELVTGFTWSVVGDGPRFRGRHHWEPSPAYAISLRARSHLGAHG
jgi:cytochrome P450